jgi:hypothetical protein
MLLAFVIRGGERKRIPGREVVREDLVILSEGDRVPADGVLLWGLNLAVDESLLTGESVAVRKAPGDREIPMGRPGGDDPALRVFGHSRGPRAGGVRGQGHRAVLGDRPDRESPPERRPRGDDPAAGDPRNRESGLHRRPCTVHRRGRRLRSHPPRLAGRSARGDHAGHGNAARGVSRRPHHLPGPRGLARLPEEGFSPAGWQRWRPWGPPRCSAWTRRGP